MDLKKHIRTIPHWPKQGIMFRDITTLIKNPEAFRHAIKLFKDRYVDKEINKILDRGSRLHLRSSPRLRIRIAFCDCKETWQAPCSH